ncbi:unnamed protein product [Owenia fusiformis]|uniref:C2H2-type domain-containing protein n=1 Tax=Owenia fusiformis TaxID=6347 RepID=A0A8S4NBJ0_OWEFU|nr:unnamed protein product [Owenia fusiformis]
MKNLKHMKHQYYVKNKNKIDKPEDAPAIKCLKQLNKATEKQVANLMCNVYALIKNKKSFRDYTCTWLCELDCTKRLDICNSYINHQYAHEFAKFIAAAQREQARTGLVNVKCVSVLCDGTTDSGTVEQEIVYIR